jgi:putative pre-16S rRNA nuclease
VAALGERRTWPPTLNCKSASPGTGPALVLWRSFLPRHALAYNEFKMTAAVREHSREVVPPAAVAGKRARILAIDYGRKRIGLALSDELGVTAQPLLTLVRTNRREDFRRLREICRLHGVHRILVGHPVHMSGEPGEMAQEAERFAARLQDELAIETKLLDERLTSWEAQQSLASSAHSRRKRRATLDSLAAAILLREYLDSNQAQAKLAPVGKG